MSEIRKLPPSVINKIAAGEVIERPASVVKELLENAVDAGATRVDVAVEKGGAELVRVADNGCGIPADQLLLAVASHATSKIADADDLFRVQTLGFRGEALASVAEISHLRIRSRTADEPAGAELEVQAGQVGPVTPCGGPVGTLVEVRHLFCNTPVRRKFLRTTQTEMGHVSEAFTRIALAYPRIHFTLRHNDQPVHELPPVEAWRDRIAMLFGAEIGEALIPVDSQDGSIRLTGLAVNPTYSRADNRMQYLFLNGRHIRDRSLQHALSEAYRGLLLTGRYPAAFLRLELPADAVDVNVHPTKLEVRFQDGGRLYSQVLGTLRKKFLTTDLTPHVGTPPAAPAPDAPAAAHDAVQAERHRQALVQWATGQLGADRAGPPGPSPGSAERQPTLPGLGAGAGDQRVPTFQPFPTWGSTPWEPAGPRREPAPSQPAPGYEGGDRAAAAMGTPAAGPLRANPPPGIAPGPGLQVHNRYLITENEAGVVIIDQHALHERILYEQLREKVLSGHLERQRLLVPEPVSLTPAEAAAVLEAQETLARLGIDIEPFGGDTVLVSAYPAMLANFSPAEVLRQLAAQLLTSDQPPQARDLFDDLLHMIACKAAIKAGDRLTPEEVTALLEQRHLYQDTHHCPHGRPTALVFTKDELDKRFKRI
jgi:DNA mismatch repair protein MutL